MADGPVAPPSLWSRVGDPFPCRFDGDCPGCDGVYWPPDPIQRWDYGTGADPGGLGRVDAERTVYTHPACRPRGTSGA